MRFNLQQAFGVADVREVPDPFGQRITFAIARIGNEGYRSFLEERGRESGFRRFIVDSSAKAAAITATRERGKRKRKKRAGRTPEGFDEVFSEIVMKEDLSGIEFDTADRSAVAKYLLLGWEGLKDADTDEPVPYSEETAIKLLSTTEPLPADLILPDGADEDEEELFVAEGTPLGDALTQWVIYQASLHEEFRRAYVETLAGN